MISLLPCKIAGQATLEILLSTSVKTVSLWPLRCVAKCCLPHIILFLYHFRRRRNRPALNVTYYRICFSTRGANVSTLSLEAKPEPVSMCRPENPYFLVKQICTMGR